MSSARRRWRKQEGELRLTDKKHPITGIVSTIIGVVTVLLFAGICFFSGTEGGSAGMVVGVLGLLCFVLSVTGFVLAWISLHQENIRTLFPTIGSILNGIQVVGYMLLYFLGTYI